jgi:hypothetical protein
MAVLRSSERFSPSIARSACDSLLTVGLYMSDRGVIRVPPGMDMMPVREVGVVCRVGMSTRFVVARRFPVMPRRVFVVFRRLLMMFGRVF